MEKNILLALLLSTALSIHAQRTISSPGGNALGTGGTSSFTVGQVVYTSNTSSLGSVS
jgi:hypothetical protein